MRLSECTLLFDRESIIANTYDVEEERAYTLAKRILALIIFDFPHFDINNHQLRLFLMHFQIKR